mmetsp:Transcript_54539/g.119306  ORF Transcript_54539/g.119306 Transcript_54539/m.119306 type:complete len:194 (-) Transcript_54539:300-881(-)
MGCHIGGGLPKHDLDSATLPRISGSASHYSGSRWEVVDDASLEAHLPTLLESNYQRSSNGVGSDDMDSTVPSLLSMPSYVASYVDSVFVDSATLSSNRVELDKDSFVAWKSMVGSLSRDDDLGSHTGSIVGSSTSRFDSQVYLQELDLARMFDERDNATYLQGSSALDSEESLFMNSREHETNSPQLRVRCRL